MTLDIMTYCYLYVFFGFIGIVLTVFGIVGGIGCLIKMKDYDDKYMHIV